MLFGEKMQKLRESKGISQKELAQMLGLTTGRIAEIESCEAIPGVCEIEAIKDILFKDIPEKNEFDKNENNGLWNRITSNKKVFGAMLVSVFSLVTLAIVIFVSVFNVPFSEDVRAIEKADASVVKIFVFNSKDEQIGQGSGFVAFDNKTVVTNYHVMEDAHRAEILASDDTVYEIANVVNFSDERDLAILLLKEESNMEPLKLGSSVKMKKGETVTAIGCPKGIRNVVSQGVLSTRNQLDYMNEIQFTAPISHGSSGGALFNEKGKIVGITYAGREDGQNLNFAIPVEELKKLYSEAGELLDANAVFMDAHQTYPHRDKYKDMYAHGGTAIKKIIWFEDPPMIKIKGYVSSCGFESEGDSSMVYYISPADEWSGDFEYDIETFKKRRRECRVLKIVEDELIAKDKVNAGDAVTIVGRYDSKYKIMHAFLICEDE